METKVTEEYIDNMIHDSEVSSFEVFGVQTIVVIKLPNGFTLVGESACVDPSNYDFKIGYDICMSRIKNQLWMLEGYLLQNKLGDLSNEK